MILVYHHKTMMSTSFFYLDFYGIRFGTTGGLRSRVYH
jgi:hypothetical protein